MANIVDPRSSLLAYAILSETLVLEILGHLPYLAYLQSEQGPLPTYIVIGYCRIYRQTAKVLMRLCGNVGWSDSVQFAYAQRIVSPISMAQTSLEPCEFVLVLGSLSY